jgi:hypothetical protein
VARPAVGWRRHDDDGRNFLDEPVSELGIERCEMFDDVGLRLGLRATDADIQAAGQPAVVEPVLDAIGA